MNLQKLIKTLIQSSQHQEKNYAHFQKFNQNQSALQTESLRLIWHSTIKTKNIKFESAKDSEASRYSRVHCAYHNIQLYHNYYLCMYYSIQMYLKQY